MLPVEGITLEEKQLGNKVREVLALIQILTNVLHTSNKQRYFDHFLKARDVAVLPGDRESIRMQIGLGRQGGKVTATFQRSESRRTCQASIQLPRVLARRVCNGRLDGIPVSSGET